MNLDPRSIPYRVIENGIRIAGFVVFGFATSSSDSPLSSVVAVVGMALLGVVVSVAWEVAYHRRFDYELTDDTFDISSGVLSRREREIPYHRIQNVDVSQNVIQRSLGIAELRLETAGGNETEAELRYVSRPEADRLQDEVGRRKRGVAAAEETPDEPAAELFSLEPRELVILGLVSTDFRLVGFITVVLSGFAPAFAESLSPGPGLLLWLGPVFAVVVLLALWAISGVRSMLRYWGFRLTQAGDELRYERGLLQRYNGTIPLEKVQTVTIRENPLARALGYATLVVETAGYSQGNGTSVESAVPLARRDRIEELARSVEPVGEVSFDRPPKRARTRYGVRYTLVVGLLTGLGYLAHEVTRAFPWWYLGAGLLVAVPLAAHFTWVNRGYHADEDYVVTRNGFWRRQTTIVPYYRVQAVFSTQTIFQRRRDLGSVTIDTASSGGISSGDAVAVDVDSVVADDLRESVGRRLQAALTSR
ncbi:PH domain-containing protein [Halobacteriales archaeon Cl-PHB]